MIEEKARSIKILFLDVDGVMTDGSVTLDARGDEIKTFDVKDGQGLKMLMAAGIEVAIITGRKSSVLAHRAEDLGIQLLFQGVEDKTVLCRKVIAERGLSREQVCSMGDDLPDLAMFRESGMCVTVSDAVKEVREVADLVTRHCGGHGAVREVCELLLKYQGKWDDALKAYTGK